MEVSVLNLYFILKYMNLLILSDLFIHSILFLRMIAVMSPEDSWVCKWQRISKYTITLNFSI